MSELIVAITCLTLGKVPRDSISPPLKRKGRPEEEQWQHWDPGGGPPPDFKGLSSEVWDLTILGHPDLGTHSVLQQLEFAVNAISQ